MTYEHEIKTVLKHIQQLESLCIDRGMDKISISCSDPIKYRDISFKTDSVEVFFYDLTCGDFPDQKHAILSIEELSMTSLQWDDYIESLKTNK